MEKSLLKSLVKQKISSLVPDLKALALDLWNHPEIAWQEFYAVERIGNLLKKYNLAAETGYCDIATAFRCEFGSEKAPSFALAAEYDALSSGHACGHNLIAAASAGAMLAAVEIMKEYNIPGKLVLLGTPAEESGSAKVKMAEKGVLDNIGAVMMAHPGWCTIPDRGSLAIRRYDVTFYGRSSHASGSPELGINALDAVMMLFTAVNFQRQQMPEFCRIHGIVTNGGVMPNIIPEKAGCRFYMRSASEDWMEILDRRFDDMVKGAAQLTGTTFTKEKFSIDCRSRKPNAVLNESFVEIMTDLGESVSPIPKAGRASSDFGDFSQKLPGAHPYFAISDHRIGAHSEDFKEAARSEKGLANMLKAASALAYTALLYMTDKTYRAKVQSNFDADFGNL
jgi:amidohydrolase